MRNAVIIHGKPSHAKYYDSAFDAPSNTGWIPWIQRQLLINDILAQTPEMPAPYKPEYTAWAKEFERFDVTSDTILVGHSCGAGFIIRWLSEHPEVKVGKVVLVAPWIDPERTGDTGTFFDFKLDANLGDRAEKLYVFNSTNDFPGAQTSANLINDAIPSAERRDFEDHGHFTDIIEFPALRDMLLK